MTDKLEPVHILNKEDLEIRPPAVPERTQTLFLWAAATAAGLVVFNVYFQLLLLDRLNQALAGPNPNSASLAVLLILIPEGVSQGFIVGLAQWFVLRRYVKNSHWWVVASILGATAFYCLDFVYLGLAQQNFAVAVAVGQLGSTGALLLFDSIRGLLLGLFQCIALRRWGRVTLLWIPVTIAAQIVSFTVAHLLSALPVASVMGWIGDGLALGLGMSYLLQVCWPVLLAREQGIEPS